MHAAKSVSAAYHHTWPHPHTLTIQMYDICTRKTSDHKNNLALISMVMAVLCCSCLQLFYPFMAVLPTGEVFILQDQVSRIIKGDSE